MSDSNEKEDNEQEVPAGNSDKEQQEQKISGETESEDKNNANQKISAETESEDKNNANQNISVDTESEDKSNANQNIPAGIENEDKNNANQEEAPIDVKSEIRDDLSAPEQVENDKTIVNDERIEAAEVPSNPETETRDHELPKSAILEEQPVAVPISSVKLQAENGRDDGEDIKKTENGNGNQESKRSFLLDDYEMYDGSESGTEEDQSNFMKELENFFRERSMEFKPPKFYGEGLNCLKLWRAVTRLGGYEKVTSCKLWRQVGESFKPPKTCTTVSWTFRGFYEKALLDYERHKTNGGELSMHVSTQSEPINIDAQASGSGRARRDAAARAMQGWHSQRLLGNGEVGDPIIKDKSSLSVQKREKQLKSMGLLKRKKPSYTDSVVKETPTKTSKLQLDTAVIDVGPPADWVKINVQRTKDCYEVYALVPGLLREEVRVQSDPDGRLVISGEPEQLDNPWGVTPFKKVVSLPTRIDPHQTSAVVTLHGQLFVRVPYERSG